MKIVCNSLIITSLYASMHSVDAGSLRNLKGKNPTSIYAGTSYSFCPLYFDEDATYVTATSPWATGALADLDKDEATNDEIATALEALNVCGGNGGAGDMVTCNDAENEAACDTLALTNDCKWNSSAGKCNGSGLSNQSYEATFADSDITCSGVRDVYVSTAHGETFANGSTCEDDSGCTLGGTGTVAKGGAIPDGSTCDNTSTADDGTVFDTTCDSKHPEDYDGYYMCYNPNSPHLYPRTICQPNDEEPAAMIEGSTFASCGWCCQNEDGDNQWTNDACGDEDDLPTDGCDSDEDGENDGYLVEVANGKNQKKDGPVPPVAGKCVNYDDIADTLNHFWGSSC